MSSLKKNIASLYVLQIAQYLLPLITLPWLARVLGPEGFGRLNFIMALIAYFTIFSDYGFNLGASRDIAVSREDIAARSKIFWATMATKALLAATGYLLLLFITGFVTFLNNELFLIRIAYFIVIGNVLTPTWYFQGIERLWVLSFITLTVRILSVPLIFIFVTTPKDIGIALMITGGMGILIGLVSMAEIVRIQSVQWSKINVNDIRTAMYEGWHLFISTAAITAYTTTNTVLLGVVAGNAAVGYYSAADKLISANKGLLSPVSQSVYPRVSYLMEHSSDDAFVLLRKVFLFQGGATLLVSIVLLSASPYLVEILYGNGFGQTVSALQWMAFLPFIIGISNILGIQVMLPLGMKKEFSRILVVAGSLNLLLLCFLARKFGAVGAAISVLITELLVSVSMGYLLYRRSVPLLKK